MEKNCIICSTIEINLQNDIRERKVDGQPVYLVIEELFGLRIDAADRSERGLPHKICPGCTDDLIVAHKLRCQLWKMQELVTYCVQKLEPGQGEGDSNDGRHKS